MPESAEQAPVAASRLPVVGPIEWLLWIAPVVENAVQRRRARLLAGLLVALLLVFVGVDLTFVATVPGYQPPWFGYVFLVGSLILNRRGHYRVASTAVAVMFPIVAFVHVITGKPADPGLTLSYLALSPMFGAILLSIRGVAILSAINLLGLLALPLAAPHVARGPADIAGPLSLNAILAVLAILYMAHRNRLETERQAELSRNEERLRLALEAANMGTWDWDLLAGTVVVSDRTVQLLGRSKAELADPQTYFGAIPPDQRGAVEAEYAPVMEGELEAVRVEHQMTRPSGESCWVQVVGHVAHDPTGRPVRLTGTIVDVTQQRHLETELRQAQKMEAVGRLAGGIAHDFNNLLTVVAANVAFLRENQPSEELSQIATAASSAASLTERLLAFSRRAVLQPRVVSLNDTVSDGVRLARRVVEENVELAVELADDLWLTRVDEGQIQQVLLNLTSNARDAMPGGGRISFQTANRVVTPEEAADNRGWRAGEFVELTVADTGEGMDEETQEHLFEPFFTRKEPGKGTGLGLASVYGIVTQSDGLVTVESARGRGATFRLLFPRAVPERARDGVQDAGGGRAILVVEEDAPVRALVAKVLERAGFHVTAVGSVALAHREEGGFDLLVADLGAHTDQSRALVARIRKQRPGAQVLLMSGDPSHAPDRGVFLVKPFDSETLLEAVRRALAANS